MMLWSWTALGTRLRLEGAGENRQVMGCSSRCWTHMFALVDAGSGTKTDTGISSDICTVLDQKDPTGSVAYLKVFADVLSRVCTAYAQ